MIFVFSSTFFLRKKGTCLKMFLEMSSRTVLLKQIDVSQTFLI